jgi:hypothetical protein
MAAMKITPRKIDVVVCIMLFLHLFFPAHGAAHLFELFEGAEPPAEYFSLHPASDSDFDSPGHDQHDTCSCELDQPSILTPPLFPDYVAVVARLIFQVTGGLPPGSPFPIFIPPEQYA